MHVRKGSLPQIWLMTDERGGDPAALGRALPKGSGIVFRHHATAPHARRALFCEVRRVARQRRHVLLLAGPPAQAQAWGADGAHHRSMLPSKGLRSVAVHDRRELETARRIGADLLFVSPVFATRSHPGARSLGIARFGLLIGGHRQRTIALGGLHPGSFRKLRGLKCHGWAAIDAFSGV
jgi:thiamine-phosphate pyrophosphorylase